MARKYYQMPIAATVKACAEVDAFYNDLAYLGSIGISVPNIAAELGVSARQVFDWRRRQWLPREPFVFVEVRAWAEWQRGAAVYQRVQDGSYLPE